jgi:hypothetical protein
MLNHHSSLLALDSGLFRRADIALAFLLLFAKALPLDDLDRLFDTVKREKGKIDVLFTRNQLFLCDVAERLCSVPRKQNTNC